jgi:hypothetical protein
MFFLNEATKFREKENQISATQNKFVKSVNRASGHKLSVRPFTRRKKNIFDLITDKFSTEIIGPNCSCFCSNTLH